MALLRTVLLFIFIYSASSAAQFLPNPNYTSYNIEDGLSNSMVYTIAQDSDGYMWFGTEDGLNRFDGQNFKVYRYDPTDANSLAGNSINQVYLAPDNSLWIATHNGISQYHKESDNFTTFRISSGLSHNNIQAVLKVGDELWLGTDKGLDVLNITTHEVSTFPIKDNAYGTSHKWIRSLAQQGNYIWVATWGGGLNRYDLTLKRFDYFRHDSNDDRSLSADTVYTVFNTAENEIWIGTVLGGLSRFKADCECFERFNPNSEYQQLTVPNLAEDADSLWIATNNGLSQFSFKTQTFSNYPMLKPYELGNITRDVRSVFISRDGTIWLGSFQGGVIAIPANGFAIQTYQYSEQAQNSLLSDDINSLMLNNGYLWTGAVGGLYRYPISENGRLGKAESVLETFTLKIEPSKDGSFWLATNDGLYHLDAELNTLSHNDHSKLIPDTAGEGAVLDVVETTQGTLLFNYIPNQKAEAKEIYDLCNKTTQNHIFFDTYANSLRGFLGLLSQCTALIGNEGGAVNMAKALFVPTFSLFSPSVDKETWQIFEDEKNVSIHLKDLKPEIYTEYDEKYIKEHTFKYFDEYPIVLIKEKLTAFINTI